MLRLFEIENGDERDWFAATSPDEALRLYRNHYELSDRDMEGLIADEWPDPSRLEVYTDEVDVETEETVTRTGAEIIATMTTGGIVCSTCQ